MAPITDSGNVLEKTIVGAFQTKGFCLVSYREYYKNPASYGEEVLLKNAPYSTIYKHNGVTEYLLKSRKYNKEIRIECKWQQVSRSVDEKLPYLYLNCVERVPEKEIIVIIDGDGWKKGAIEWLRDAVQNKKYENSTNPKTIRIFNLKQFVTWVNKEF